MTPAINPPRSIASIIEYVEGCMALDAHRLASELEPHKQHPDPSVHSTAYRLATALRDFARIAGNVTAGLSQQARASLAGR
jgi:hypothetical protein